MAPGQIPRPTRHPNRPPAPRLKLIVRQPEAHLPPPNAYHTHQLNAQRELWLQRSQNRFHQCILWGESQPSNEFLRRVDRPDGETSFAVAYGDAPDDELRALLENIYAKHGDLGLCPDGRDSTGKHWIHCWSRVHPGSSQRPALKAVICVWSKMELATVPRPRTEKGKDRVPRFDPAAAHELSEMHKRRAEAFGSSIRADTLRNREESQRIQQIIRRYGAGFRH